MTLPAFATERRAAASLLLSAPGTRYRRLQLSIDISHSHGVQQQKPAGHRCCCRTMGQTDGRTPDRYTDPAPHTVRAASIKIKYLKSKNLVKTKLLQVDDKTALTLHRMPRGATCSCASINNFANEWNDK